MSSGLLFSLGLLLVELLFCVLGVYAIVRPDASFGIGWREELDLSSYVGGWWVSWLVRVFGIVLFAVGILTGLLGVFSLLVVLA